MEHKKDSDASKMQRMLSNHCLDSLVFEKRERKQTANPLVQIYADIHQKQMQKKTAKKIEKSPPKDKKTKKIEKKTMKAEKQLQKSKKQKNAESPPLKEKNIIEKSKIIKSDGKQKVGSKSNISQNKLENAISQHNAHIKTNKIKKKQEACALNIQISKPQLKNLSKISDLVEKHQKQLQQHSEGNLSINVPQIQKQQNPIQIEQEQQQDNNEANPDEIEQQNEDEAEDNSSQKEKQQDKSEQNVMNSGRRLRQRKTKGQAMKRFTYLDDLDIDEEQQECYYEGKKRRNTSNNKNIFKNENRWNLLNRIFRKIEKVDLPSFSLSVDILKLNLNIFSEKFKTFDMVHFSLPAQILVKLPDISAIIPKGFVFIWVEKKQISIGYHILNRWGFDVIDQIMWIKTDKGYNQLIPDEINDQDIFRNVRSTCLVGYKCSLTQKTEYCTKISNNLIFALQKKNSIEKPDEIYEIGDLMMPGARKLQVGPKLTSGWLTLNHKETSILRCHKCLKRYEKVQLYLVLDKKIVQCQNCLIYDRLEQESQNEKQNFSQLKKQLDLASNSNLKIINEFIVKNQVQSCVSCGRQIPALTGLIKIQSQQKGFCLECYTSEIREYPKIICIYRKQSFFITKALTCSQCGKKQLCREYYECMNCKKGHLICSDCFWAGSEYSQSEIGEGKKKCFQWRHKQIIGAPQNKTNCFVCHQECTLPYWACQTCQGWYWCGNCDKSSILSSSPHHCHCTQSHYEYMII